MRRLTAGFSAFFVLAWTASASDIRVTNHDLFALCNSNIAAAEAYVSGVLDQMRVASDMMAYTLKHDDPEATVISSGRYEIIAGRNCVPESATAADARESVCRYLAEEKATRIYSAPIAVWKATHKTWSCGGTGGR
jgi:hypothetical protein